MNVSQLLKKPLAGAAALASTIPVFLLIAATPAKADWPNTNATKWVQMPNTQNGLDVLACQLPGGQPIILADDFLCSEAGPITDMHIWASWLGDQPAQNTVITLGIWSDLPKSTNTDGKVTPSQPDRMLWSETFAPGQYQMRYWKSSQEQFWDPDMGLSGILGPDHAIWQYNFYPTNAFVQAGTTAAPVIYWLSVTAVAGAVGSSANGALFGWKTSDTNWNDDAVFGHLATNGIPLGDWQELFNPTIPTAPLSLDLAFALTTSSTLTNPPPTPANKWLQPPNVQNGMDVKATFADILADDFLCTMAGTITNIQIWTSWLSDNVDSNATFTLGIWSDVPSATIAGAVGFSHPGFLLWSETFAPGAYSSTLYGTGQETFIDPDSSPPGGIIGSDTKVWLYNFNPVQPFCQQGSPNEPVVYWLSMTAQTATPAATLAGWKTSVVHWNDDAVHGHVTTTGTALGDWMDMHNPTTGASIDLSFLLNNGPPGPDCDTNQVTKFVQWPDQSSQGLDVRDTTNKILGDDFLCKSVGPIDGVTIWGSWINNLVDNNATFQLGLWTDVPGVTNAAGIAPSHPGTLLCTETFLPPQTVGTSVQRYQSSLYASNLQETFYDPDLTGTSGFLGSDSQIWRYDFYPQNSCWKQRGLPVAPEVYWISLTETPSPSPGGEFLFGWKTSTNHFGDDAVVGHLDTNNNALGDWKDMHDPRSGTSLDLSFELRAFPVVGINKDLKNTTTNVADGLQIILAGVHVITWHYDGTPPWPFFSLSTAGGDTTLTWSGQTIPPGATIHVGFDIAGAALPAILGMNWLQGGVIVGHPIQGCFHTWNNFNSITVNNCLNFPGLTVLAATVEFYPDVLRLDLMNSTSQRSPLSTSTLEFAQPYVMAGGAMLIPVPAAPAGAHYGMFTIQLGDPSGQLATTDYLLLPLDNAFPPLLTTVGLAAGMVNFNWSVLPGRIYHLQSSPDLINWGDAGLGDLSGDGDTLNASVPMSGSQLFYRVVLVPQ